MVKRNRKKDFSDPFSIKNDKHGKLLSFSYRKEWTEEAYIAEAGTKEIVGKSFNTSRLAWVVFALIFFMSILFGRVAWLQIVKGDYYYELAEGNRIRIERVEAKRGIIYDSKMQPLVRNVANFLLYFIPADLPKDENDLSDLIGEAASILGIDKEEIMKKLSFVEPHSLEAYQPLFITDNIEYEKAIKLYLKSFEMPGVVVSSRTRREYELSSLSLSHILGYTGKISEEELDKFGDEYLMIDYVGKMGLEYFWENELKGKSGKKQIEVDALGKEKKIISDTDPVDGHNLVLSLDTELQDKIEEITNKYLDDLGLKKASIIVMDPNNGEILALVSLPGFDNNVFARGISQEEYKKLLEDPSHPLFNRSISGEYPSGSTFKMIMASAALQEKIISENTKFLSTGGLRIGQWFFPDWRAGGHGVTDVRKGIADSVNTFFYYIGGGYEDFKGLGVDKIAAYSKLFGLGEQSGIDLPGEASGFIPSRGWKEEVKNERWYIGDTYHLSIGQGDLLVTPLQVANYTSVFANGGKLYRPHLVKKILSGKDQDIQDIEEEPVKEDFIDDYNIMIVRQGMRQTITSGSATSLQSVPVAVAGKTGTAQWSTTKDPHAWFTGFAPYDEPKIVVTVLLEEGRGETHPAIPLAKEILTWYFSR